jgi:hypothetical protein
VNPVIATVKEALGQAANHMTTGVRKSARQAGWPSSVAKTLTYEATDTGFQFSMGENAMDWEYGTVGRSPSPAVRQFQNRTDEVEAQILSEIEATLKAKGIL